MHIAVLGVGAVGSRVARQLVSTEVIEHVTVVDANTNRAKAVLDSLAETVKVTRAAPGRWQADDVDVVVVATGVGLHRGAANEALKIGAHVVSLSGSPEEVQELLAMDNDFRRAGLVMAVGAGFSPGLSCVLAAHGAKAFDQVDEVHIARVGSGGLACAQQRRSALRQETVDWIDGAWVSHKPGSGRELCWFPDPVGAQDCYRASLPEALLLQPVFDDLKRTTTRLSSSRKERWSARLLLPARFKEDEKLGALRVEIRGLKGSKRETTVFGVIDRPAVGAGVVATVAAVWAASGRLGTGGSSGLAGLVETTPFLSELASRGVKAAVFTGAEDGGF